MVNIKHRLWRTAATSEKSQIIYARLKEHIDIFAISNVFLQSEIGHKNGPKYSVCS